MLDAATRMLETSCAALSKPLATQAYLAGDAFTRVRDDDAREGGCSPVIHRPRSWSSCLNESARESRCHCYTGDVRFAAIVLVICGCGRYGFDAAARDGTDATGATDATGGAPDGSCTWGPWSVPSPVEGFEGVDWERGPAQRTDRLEILFARYEVVNSEINAQILSATRTSTAVPYGPGGPVVELNDLMRNDLDASLSVNGLILIFASDRTGTQRAYEARRPTVGAAFSSPVLAAGIGPSTLYGPELTADGLGLYFTVINDLWVARRPTLGQDFQSPTQLGFAGDEASVSADEREIYFMRVFKLFVRARASIADPFTNEVEIVVPGLSGTGAPDLSDDGTELLIILNDQLQRLTRACI